MGYITGKKAAVNGLQCLREWRITDSTEPVEAGPCSDSDGAMVTAEGNDDWSGSVLGLGAAPPAMAFPGRTFTFTGALRNKKGLTGPAIVDALTVYWDVENADVLYYKLDFSGNGALTRGSYTITSAAVPAPTTAKGMGALFDTTLCPIRRGILNVRCENGEYVDTSTAGCVKRDQGNFVGQFQLDCYFDDFETLPTKNSFKELKLQTAASTYWIMKFAQILNVDHVVPIRGEGRSKAIGVHATVSGTWSGYHGGVQGGITDPAGNAIWPIPT